MPIEKIGSNLIRPPRSGGTPRASVATGQADTDELRRVERADRVEISNEGRRLAARGPDDAPASEELRNATIRSRIDRGFYNDPATVEQVASHLVASGDLDVTS